MRPCRSRPTRGYLLVIWTKTFQRAEAGSCLNLSVSALGLEPRPLNVAVLGPSASAASGRLTRKAPPYDITRARQGRRSRGGRKKHLRQQQLLQTQVVAVR